MKLVVDEFPNEKEDCLFCEVSEHGGKHDNSGYPLSKEYYCSLSAMSRKGGYKMSCKGKECPYLIDRKAINHKNRIDKIIEEADKRDLTYMIDSDGKYCICDIDWIGRFDTLEELEEYLDIER